ILGSSKPIEPSSVLAYQPAMRRAELGVRQLPALFGSRIVVRRHPQLDEKEHTTMSDGCSKRVPKPSRRTRRWTSFVAAPARGRVIRGLVEDGNPGHRIRVEHNRDTLLIHVAGEHGQGWTTIAIDRATREWAVAQRTQQQEAAEAAYGQL